MMRIFLHILIFVFFLNCSKEKVEVSQENTFLKDWKVFRYPYSRATLSLLKDHSFKYYEVGHLSNSHSNGKWHKKGDTLFLNSDVSKECLYLDDFALIKYKKFETLETTFPNCQSAEGSEFFVEFNNSRFIIENDSLNYLDLNFEYKNQYGNYKIFKDK